MRWPSWAIVACVSAVGVASCNPRASASCSADVASTLQVSAEVGSARAKAVQRFLAALQELSSASNALLEPLGCQEWEEQAVGPSIARLRAELSRLQGATENCGSAGVLFLEKAAELSPASERSSDFGCGPPHDPWAGTWAAPTSVEHCSDASGIFGLSHVGCMWSSHYPNPSGLDRPRPVQRGHTMLTSDLAVEGNASELGGNATTVVYVKPKVHRNRYLLIANAALVVLALVGSCALVVWCSPLRGTTFTTDERTGNVSSTGGLSRKLVQVCLPFWVPVTPTSSGALFGVVLAALLLSAFGFGILWVALQIRLMVFIAPDVFSNFVGASFHPALWVGTPTLVTAFVMILAWPSVYMAWNSQLRGREAQWLALGYRLFCTLGHQVAVLPLSYATRAQENWVVNRQADKHWHWVRTFFLFYIISGIMFSVGDRAIAKFLEIKWRRFTTGYILDRYMANRAYYLLNSNSGREGGVDNPDARIQTDVSEMMSQLLDLCFAVLDLIFGIISSSVLTWTVVPSWTMAAVVYTFLGSTVALWFSWQFARLGFEIQKKEGDWRFSMVNIRSNAEAIAFYGGERTERERVDWRFEAIQEFSIRVMWWGMGFGLYHAVYDAGIQVAPTILITRMYFHGQIDYGGMHQFNTAFGSLVGKLSFLLNHSGGIAAVATAVTRLGDLLDSIDRAKESPGIRVKEHEDSTLVVRDLAVQTPNLKTELFHGLSFSLGAPGEPQRLMVVGRSGVGKSSLMRAVAGLWVGGAGEVQRPPNSSCMFLPQQPYMPLGTLRDQLRYPCVSSFVEHGSKKEKCSDHELRSLLEDLGLGDLPNRWDNGFDHVEDWSRVLSRGEQQRVSAIRCLTQYPALAVLDEATSALPKEEEDLVYQRLYDLGLPYLSVGHRMSIVKFHDTVLELDGGASWRLHSRAEFEQLLESKNME